MRVAGIFVALLPGAALLKFAVAAGGVPQTVPSATPDCGSVVIVRCDPPLATDPRREAARRIEARRKGSTEVMDRIIIEDDAIRGNSPESTLNRALSRPLVAPGEHSFAIGEGAQCTCKNICPPWPLPCCSCTEQSGSRHATSPGWKPTN